MRFRQGVALGFILAGVAWLLVTLHSGVPLRSYLPGYGHSVALVEAAPQVSYDVAEKNNIDIYKRVSPSVVNITSQTLEMSFWWGPVPASGEGSGFFINQDGYILTNYHVIANARNLSVSWTPQRNQTHTYNATVVGRAPDLDLAVIKVASANFPAVTLGDSGNLQVGQEVLAIGNPFGLPGTMTRGIISSIRTVREGDDEQSNEPAADIENAIQTDAAINPGNSGGPLLNSDGQVIGIDTMIYSGTGSNVGIGFAIPINSAKAVLDQLLKTGTVRKVAIGIDSVGISAQMARQLSLPVDHGILVLAVNSGSLASHAGLHGGTQPGYIGNTPVRFGGDIITAVNGETLQDAAQLSNFLLLQKPGATVTLTVNRGGRQIQVPLTLENEP